MADTYYAWSPIVYGAVFDEKNPTMILGVKSLALGEEVSADKLGISDEQFQELVDIGSVRNYALPEEYRDTNASPQQILSSKVRASMDGVDTGEIDPTLMTTLMRRTTDVTEGQKEVTQTGEVVPAPGTPADNPPASNTPPQTNP